VLRLCRQLPDDYAGKHVSRQLIRCSSGGGSNYEEARGAESLADFTHKLAVAKKEIRESFYWLRLIDGELLQDDQLAALIREARELSAILTTSVRTERMRMKAKRRADRPANHRSGLAHPTLPRFARGAPPRAPLSNAKTGNTKR
jgi:four helix bundle protein